MGEELSARMRELADWLEENLAAMLAAQHRMA
jgi:hypothetical protein